MASEHLFVGVIDTGAGAAVRVGDVANQAVRVNVVAGGGAAGALTAATPTTASVGAVSASAVSANANRKGLVLINTSTGGQRISLNLAGGTAVLDSGVTLWPRGVFQMDATTLTTAAIHAIASAGSASLAVQEFT